jgi:hypothetical protein
VADSGMTADKELLRNSQAASQRDAACDERSDGPWPDLIIEERRTDSSGKRVSYYVPGTPRPDVNHYLKWAYAEAANVSMMHRRRHPQRHVSRLYTRVKSRRGHPKAIGAVGRHLAEATYWMLTKHEPYRDPAAEQTEEAKREA